MSRGAKPGTIPLTDRIRIFYETNPGELLTVEDMAIKFDATEGSVVNALLALKHDGTVRRMVVYGAGEQVTR